MTVSAWADEHTPQAHHDAADAHEASSGGLPQFNPESYTSQIFWILLCFGLLYFLMAKFALPQVSETIEKRRTLIANDLDRANQLRQETENTKIAYDKALIQADQHASSFIANTMDEVNAEIAKRTHEATDEINKSIDEALQRLEDEKTEALKTVDTVAHDIASDLVSALMSKPNSKRKKA